MMLAELCMDMLSYQVDCDIIISSPGDYNIGMFFF